MIEFAEVSKTYGGRTILEDVSLTIQKGEFVCVTGPSGAGKSTLINLLIGHSKPTSGNITIDRTHVETMDFDMRQRYRRKLGIVFQDYKLLPQKTVYENVMFALEVSDRADGKAFQHVEKVLDIVGLSARREHYPHELSGGEQQRTAIARALVHSPKLLIADEPTGNLDSVAAKNVIDVLRRVHEHGTTILLTTHNTDIIKYVNERVIILSGGQVTFDGHVTQLPKKG